MITISFPNVSVLAKKYLSMLLLTNTMSKVSIPRIGKQYQDVGTQYQDVGIANQETGIAKKDVIIQINETIIKAESLRNT